MHKRPLPLLRFLFALFMALAFSFPNTGLAGCCEAEKDPFPDPTTDVSDGSDCPPGSFPGSSLAAKDKPKETSPSPAPDPFPDPSAVDNGTPPPLSAGGAGEGSGDAWDDSDTGDGSGR